MPGNKWPVPNQYFEPDQARRAVASCLEEVAMEDELGFDWIACAEHHYSPFNLAPNVTVLASALTQHVKRAKIAILGALIPLDRQSRSHRRRICDDRQSLRRAAGRGAAARRALRISRLQRQPGGIALAFRGGLGPHHQGLDRPHAVRLGGQILSLSQRLDLAAAAARADTADLCLGLEPQESGEFAARKKVGLGLAFTNLPLAAEAAKHYRAKCAEHGWTPKAEQIIYQLPIHVGETDEQAFDAVRPMFGHAMPAGGLADMNRLVATSGFFGKGDTNLLARFKDLSADEPRSLEEALERGTMIMRRAEDRAGADQAAQSRRSAAACSISSSTAAARRIRSGARSSSSPKK